VGVLVRNQTKSCLGQAFNLKSGCFVTMHSNMIKEAAFNKTSLLIEDTKVKHTNFTSIYKDNYHEKYMQK
jgi:hypothetical protein